MNVMQIQHALSAEVALLRESTAIQRAAKSRHTRGVAEQQVRQSEQIVKDTGAMLRESRWAALRDAQAVMRDQGELQQALEASKGDLAQVGLSQEELELQRAIRESMIEAAQCGDNDEFDLPPESSDDDGDRNQSTNKTNLSRIEYAKDDINCSADDCCITTAFVKYFPQETPCALVFSWCWMSDTSKAPQLSVHRLETSHDNHTQAKYLMWR